MTVKRVVKPLPVPSSRLGFKYTATIHHVTFDFFSYTSEALSLSTKTGNDYSDLLLRVVGGLNETMHGFITAYHIVTIQQMFVAFFILILYFFQCRLGSST